VTAEQSWFAALWPTVRSFLPPPPAMIVEVGCGPLGGFVPRLCESGYDAVGVDPTAPEGDHYRRVEFERSELSGQLEGVVACTSLHHVADPGEVLDKIANALAPAGVMIVVEWDWESFDDATARWCFERLDPSRPEGWLHHHRKQWAASGQAWEDHFSGWAEHHGLHSANRLLDDLDRRFERISFRRGPYFFPELLDTSEADELQAIDAEQIRPGRIDYVGTPN
jgi:SAM-dependent methyltransferase